MERKLAYEEFLMEAEGATMPGDRLIHNQGVPVAL